MQGDLYKGIVKVGSTYLRRGTRLKEVLTQLRDKVRGVKHYDLNEFFAERDNNFMELFLNEVVEIEGIYFEISLIFDKEEELLRKYKLRHTYQDINLLHDKEILERTLNESIQYEDYEVAGGLSYENEFIIIREVADFRDFKYDFSILIKYESPSEENTLGFDFDNTAGLVREFTGDLLKGEMNVENIHLGIGSKLVDVEESLESVIERVNEYSIETSQGEEKTFIEITLKIIFSLKGYCYRISLIFDKDEELLRGYRLEQFSEEVNILDNKNMLEKMFNIKIDIVKDEAYESFSYSNEYIGVFCDYSIEKNLLYFDIDLNYNIVENTKVPEIPLAIDEKGVSLEEPIKEFFNEPKVEPFTEMDNEVQDNIIEEEPLEEGNYNDGTAIFSLDELQAREADCPVEEIPNNFHRDEQEELAMDNEIEGKEGNGLLIGLLMGIIGVLGGVLVKMAIDMFTDRLFEIIMTKAIAVSFVVEIITFVVLNIILALPILLIIFIIYRVGTLVFNKKLTSEQSLKKYKNAYIYTVLVVYLLLWGGSLLFEFLKTKGIV